MEFRNFCLDTYRHHWLFGDTLYASTGYSLQYRKNDKEEWKPVPSVREEEYVN